MGWPVHQTPKPNTKMAKWIATKGNGSKWAPDYLKHQFKVTNKAKRTTKLGNGRKWAPDYLKQVQNRSGANRRSSSTNKLNIVQFLFKIQTPTTNMRMQPKHLGIRGRFYTRVTELEPSDEYPVSNVGLGQELKGRRADFRVWKYWVIRPTFGLRLPNLPRRHICLTGVGEGNTTRFKGSDERGTPATYQSSCYAADARWDGGTANRRTDTSTWAPEARKGNRP
ncbi:hypothetical protein TIFTF001_029629 [Ficus carica]|uniref:Uncharacterized protein n=1 Tax=Ficus carica TaxID=3494 RepID=A0AA88DS19_FICCA|nr:hypothetical protein TIFTF001_029629 [Ficus carica]